MCDAFTALVLADRDALVCLGLLAHAYVRFDEPVAFPGEPPSHTSGLNIHAAVVDNADGELLALEQNQNHADAHPLRHAEIRAIDAAIARIRSKRPRGSEPFERYYKSFLFMGPGTDPEDCLNAGSTLYTTLEPCPMCASALLVCRMKRVVYVIPDARFGGGWPLLKPRYFPADESAYALLDVRGRGSPFADRVVDLQARLVARTAELRADGVRDTHFLDHCRAELQEAFELFASLNAYFARSASNLDMRNERTRSDLLFALNLPR